MIGGRIGGERGATTILVALMASGLMFIAAIVIDFGLLRVDRSSNQLSADTAATAAASALASNGGEAACNTAVGYLEDRYGVSNITGIDCTQFPVLCDTSATATVREVGTSGLATLTLVHPVDDNDPLMDAGAISAGSQPVLAIDGDRCDRFGVQVSEEQPALFAGIGGKTSNRSTVHAVARPTVLPEGTRPINLLVLERHECSALTIGGGGGGQGGIIVDGIFDPVAGEIRPGTIAVDSDGTVNCGPNGTIDADGTGSIIRADGAPGCAAELLALTGQGCGVVDVLAPGQPGCVLPACSTSGTVAPDPRRVAEPLTRAAVDWQFNCKSSYPVSYDIGGCVYDNRPPYIDQFVAAMGTSGTPAGFQSYTAAGHPCNVGPSDVILIPQNNWHIDCDLRIRGVLKIQGGNILADGDIEVNSQGVLDINRTNSNSYGSWTDGDNFQPTAHSGRAVYIHMRNGTLSKGAQASMFMPRTMVYLSASSKLELGGGTGALEWVAPIHGPFENLALWSESTSDHTFKGGTTLALEGVFFAPLATIVYTGSGSQQQVAAQFVSLRLSVQGNGILKVQPSITRSIKFPARIASLIR